MINKNKMVMPTTRIRESEAARMTGTPNKTST